MANLPYQEQTKLEIKINKATNGAITVAKQVQRTHLAQGIAFSIYPP